MPQTCQQVKKETAGENYESKLTFWWDSVGWSHIRFFSFSSYIFSGFSRLFVRFLLDLLASIFIEGFLKRMFQNYFIYTDLSNSLNIRCCFFIPKVSSFHSSCHTDCGFHMKSQVYIGRILEDLVTIPAGTQSLTATWSICWALRIFIDFYRNSLEFYIAVSRISDKFNFPRKEFQT